jgi:hypothetical protein
MQLEIPPGQRRSLAERKGIYVGRGGFMRGKAIPIWSIVGALIAVIVLVVAMSSIALAGMPSDQGVRIEDRQPSGSAHDEAAGHEEGSPRGKGEGQGLREGR